MPKENIWKLLARKMAGDATEEELSELQDLLRGDAEMKYTAETFLPVVECFAGSIDRGKWNKKVRRTYKRRRGAPCTKRKRKLTHQFLKEIL